MDHGASQEMHGSSFCARVVCFVGDEEEQIAGSVYFGSRDPREDFEFVSCFLRAWAQGPEGPNMGFT